MKKSLKDNFSLVQHDSVVKRIRFVVNNYKKKHHDKRVRIIFDHMFSKNNYTVFMITMRIGKQGIPLWFRCFEAKDSSYAFEESLLKDGISYVSSLFSDDFELIFLMFLLLIINIK